jgi:hypothetical protein
MLSYDACVLPILNLPGLRVVGHAHPVVSDNPFSLFNYTLVCCLVFLASLPVWVTTALGHPIMDLQRPQSFIASSSGEYYFIANANGEPGKQDNNGFISKLNTEGEPIDLHFISGGSRGTELHSPNGMAMVGKTLYVADLDTIRGFDSDTGQSTVSLSLSQFHVTELTDLIADGAGQLFTLDTEGNAIYQIDTTQNHVVSLYLQSDKLGSPRGLAVQPKSGRLVVVSLDKGTVLDIAQDHSISEIISNSFFTGHFRNLSGVDFDQFGNMYLSDLTAGKIWRVKPDKKMQVIAEFLISPTSVRIDRKKHMILVPYLYANGAEMNGLERPSNAEGDTQKKKRTLSDYGLGMMGGDTPKK